MNLYYGKFPQYIMSKIIKVSCYPSTGFNVQSEVMYTILSPPYPGPVSMKLQTIGECQRAAQSNRELQTDSFVLLGCGRACLV